MKFVSQLQFCFCSPLLEVPLSLSLSQIHFVINFWPYSLTCFNDFHFIYYFLYMEFMIEWNSRFKSYYFDINKNIFFHLVFWLVDVFFGESIIGWYLILLFHITFFLQHFCIQYLGLNFLCSSLNYTTLSFHVSNKKSFIAVLCKCKLPKKNGCIFFLKYSYWNSLLTYMVKINALCLNGNIFRCFIFPIICISLSNKFYYHVFFFPSHTLRMI